MNLSNTTPVAPSGNANLIWQSDGTNISAYVSNTVPASAISGVLSTAQLPNIPAGQVSGSWLSWTPVITPTVTGLSVSDAQYFTIGPRTDFKLALTFTTPTTTTASFYVTLPAPAVGQNQLIASLATQSGANLPTLALINIGLSAIAVSLLTGANFAAGLTTLYISGSYRTA